MALLASKPVASHQTFQTSRTSSGRNHQTTIHPIPNRPFLYQGPMEAILRFLPPCACLCLHPQIPTQLQNLQGLPNCRPPLIRGNRQSQSSCVPSGAVGSISRRIPSRAELCVPAQGPPAPQVPPFTLRTWAPSCAHQDSRSRLSILPYCSNYPPQNL